MTDTRNAMIYMGQTFMTVLLPIVMMVILARFLSADDFGVLALAQVYAVFAASLSVFGMTEVFERGYFEYRDDRHRQAALLYGIVLFTLVNFVVLAAISELFSDTIAAFLGFEQPRGLIVLSFSGQFFSGATMLWLLFYRNRGQAATYTAYMVLASALNFVAALGFVIYAGTGVAGIPLAQTLAWGVVFLLLAGKTRAVLAPRLDLKVFAAAFRLAHPLVPRIFLGVMATQLDKFLLGQLATVSSVGIFSIAQRLANAVFVFMTTLQNVFSPTVYARMFDMRDGDDGTIGRYLTPFAYVSILAALMLLLTGEEIVTWFLPSEYHGAVGALIVLCLYYGFLFFGKLTGKQLMYAQRPGLVSLLAFGGLAVNIATCIPLVMKWGTIGAAWGTFISGTATGAAALWLAQRYYRIRWQWPVMGAIFGLFFLAGGGLLIISELGASYVWRFCFKLAALAVFLYIGVRSGLVRVANFRAMRDSLFGAGTRSVGP